MAHGYVKTPQEVVKEGDEIDVMIIDVDRKKKQIRLSMKATIAPPEEKEEVEIPRVRRATPSTAAIKPRPESTPGSDTRERNSRKGSSSKGKSEKFEMPVSDEPSEPEPTAFEIAWQTALDRQKAEKAARSKKAKPNQQQDDILDRTLKNRLPIN